jgi:hypothetical protein
MSLPKGAIIDIFPDGIGIDLENVKNPDMKTINKIIKDYSFGGKNQWLLYSKQYRINHPEVSFKDSLKLASIEYKQNKEKNKKIINKVI